MHCRISKRQIIGVNKQMMETFFSHCTILKPSSAPPDQLVNHITAFIIAILSLWTPHINFSGIMYDKPQDAPKMEKNKHSLWLKFRIIFMNLSYSQQPSSTTFHFVCLFSGHVYELSSGIGPFQSFLNYLKPTFIKEDVHCHLYMTSKMVGLENLSIILEQGIGSCIIVSRFKIVQIHRFNTFFSFIYIKEIDNVYCIILVQNNFQ